MSNLIEPLKAEIATKRRELEKLEAALALLGGKAKSVKKPGKKSVWTAERRAAMSKRMKASHAAKKKGKSPGKKVTT